MNFNHQSKASCERPDDVSKGNQCDRNIHPTSKVFTFGWFDWFCLWYPPGWLILFNRHWQHYHTDPDGWNWVEYILFLIPGGFYLALFIRWLRLGCRAPKAIHHTVDHAYQRSFVDEVLAHILKHYFRAELFHLEHLPPTGPLIVATNHAGMCFPWDIVTLSALLNQTRKWHAQPLAHQLFFDHPWLRWWLPAGWLEALGGVRATLPGFETAVSSANRNSIVLYAPEGWHGLAKGWRHRYQLTKFDPSFIRLSDRYQVPILPIACIGNESLHPWTIDIKSIGRRLGLPIFPLSALLIPFVLFPSMGVWANRTRLRYYIQPIEKPWEENGLDHHQLQKRAIGYRIAQETRSRLQVAINEQRHH